MHCFWGEMWGAASETVYNLLLLFTPKAYSFSFHPEASRHDRLSVKFNVPLFCELRLFRFPTVDFLTW